MQIAIITLFASAAVVVADVPNATCQAQMDKYCNLPGVCAIVVPGRECTAPLYAANSSGVDHGPGKAHDYRCFSGASLNANHTTYTSGGCYCSGTTDAIRQILCHCEHGNTSSWDAKHHNCTVPLLVNFNPPPPPPPSLLSPPSPSAPGGACKPNAAGCCDFSGEWCNHAFGAPGSPEPGGIFYVFTQPTGTCTVSGNIGGSGCLVPHCYNGTVSGDTMSIVYSDKHTHANTTRTATLKLDTPQDILTWHYPGPNGNSKWYRGGNTGNYTCRMNSTLGPRPSSSPGPPPPPQALARTTELQPAQRVGSGDAGSIWNGMIAPLSKMKFASVIWYQGESNYRAPQPYACSFPAMIHDWRAKFASPTLPFYFVQLAPCFGHKDCGDFVGVRNAQMAGLLLPNVSYATAADLGDKSSPYVSVHPRRKQELCRRLALQALKMQYGMAALVTSGPEFESVAATLQGAALTITYKAGTAGTLHPADTADAPGGCAAGSPFEVQSSGGSWVSAKFTIVGETVTLAMPGGTEALASTGVRYAWTTAPTCMIYNGAGAPGTGPNGTQPTATPGATGIAGTPFCWTGTAPCPP